MNKALLAATTATSNIKENLQGSEIEQIRQTVTIPSFLSGAVTMLLIAGSILSLFFLIFGGIKWITSGGDKEKLGSAQKTITAAIIGLALAFSAWVILTLVFNFFGLETSSQYTERVYGPYYQGGQ